MSAPTGHALDRLQRPLHDLRVSVTDRCNFRCPYCMPRAEFGPGHRFLPRADVLTFEEIHRVVQRLVPMGLRKVRLTGGEPLLRRDLERLVAQLAQLPVERCLTTNGVLLAAHARTLRDAGLQRVTVSLDALDAPTFAAMSDTDVSPDVVLHAIDAALGLGLGVKVNAVLQRGVNEHAVVPLVERFRGTPVEVRFIEYMDVGTTNGWQRDRVVPAEAVLARLQERFDIAPVEVPPLGRVAERWRLVDGSGVFGVIASVTRPFCGGCTRLRLSTDGRLYTCLFGSQGHPLREVLRAGDDAALDARLRAVWGARDDRYSELRGQAQSATPRVEMSAIGG